MKANELIIGCLVTSKKWREKPFKITRINDSGKYYCGITAEGSQVGPFLIEELVPIPLTAEILEKNGFETEDAKDGGFVLCDDFYDIFIYEWSDSIWVVRYESTEMNIPFEQATMSYVHELQHFLKSNGVEKEIEL